MLRPRLAAVLIAPTLALFAPAVARADFTVNSTLDAGDGSPEGTGSNAACDSDPGVGVVCTLREAIQESNAALLSIETITFDPVLFDGTTPGTLTPATALPTITNPVTIDGGDCGSIAPAHKPCVGINAPGGSNALTIGTNAGGSSIRGIAAFNSNVGVEVSSPGVTITNSWFGVTLAIAVDGNTIGVSVPAAGTTATVGGTTSAERNVFAGSTQAAIVLQGNTNTVKGNYIGTGPSGTVAAPNAENIRIGDPTVNATGNVIGGTASAAQQATATCDGPCNVISAATGNGIDLEPSGALPANQTTISGNFIGLDANGTLDLGNSEGVDVGPADDVTIGGPATGDRNFIGGNDNRGIGSFDTEAGNLTVSNNFIGLNSSGTAAIPDTTGGASILAAGTTLNNRFGGNETAPSQGALSMSGGGLQQVTGNIIGLGTGGQDLGVLGTGITARNAPGTAIGSAGAGNTVVNMRGGTSLGIRIAGDMHTVAGNRIGVDSGGTARPNEGDGIQLDEDADNDTIGGATAAAENVISNNAGNAIEVQGFSNDILIDRNRGSGNGGLFIDLNEDGPGNPVPGGNNGVQAPTVISASTVAASGTVPDAGATVRVFRRAAIFAGQVDAFVGQTTATGFTWSLTYPAAIPPGGQLVATQTPPSTMNTSELSAGFAYSTAPVQKPPAGGGGSQTTLTGVTAAQILAALKTDLKAALKALRKAGTRRLAKSVSVKGIDALVPGTVAAKITANAPAGTAKRIVVISGKKTFAAPGKGTLKLKPTKKGRRLLRRSRRLKLSVALTFTDRGGKRTPASGRVTVKRKRR